MAITLTLEDGRRRYFSHSYLTKNLAREFFDQNIAKIEEIEKQRKLKTAKIKNSKN
jgi:hypothetical protein